MGHALAVAPKGTVVAAHNLSKAPCCGKQVICEASIRLEAWHLAFGKGHSLGRSCTAHRRAPKEIDRVEQMPPLCALATGGRRAWDWPSSVTRRVLPLQTTIPTERAIRRLIFDGEIARCCITIVPRLHHRLLALTRLRIQCVSSPVLEGCLAPTQPCLPLPSRGLGRIRPPLKLRIGLNVPLWVEDPSTLE